MLRTIKRALFGSPLKSAQLPHERLTNPVALAVFASDALSSTAYATEEILVVLTLAGTAILHLAWPLAVAIALLIALVAVSYRQTIHAYPGGGGAYIVARANLGELAGQTAGAALMIDYVLTVAVSVAAGIAALISAVPALQSEQIPLGILAIALIALANLRGVRESGALFALPTYGFVGCVFVMLLVAGWRWLARDLQPVEYPATHLSGLHEGVGVAAVSAWLILRAFSSGCTALTGIEAVSNGTSAFRPPEARNASLVMTWLAALLAAMFLGITFFAQRYGLLPYSTEAAGYQTLVSQLAEQVFGGRGVPYYLLQGFTMVILLLAANTAFADFPRLASLHAKDGFLPRQFTTLGDKLVFANGIIALAACSAVLLVVFRGDTHHLIPLYAVGVFISFTLSQCGMVVKWWREREPGWQRGILINGFGALITGIVMVVVAVTKFTHGAWIVLLLIPSLVWVFFRIKRHYDEVAKDLSLDRVTSGPPSGERTTIHHTVIVPISGLHRGVLRAFDYASALSEDVRVIYVNLHPEQTPKLEERWGRWGRGFRLVILDSHYRSVIEPLLLYIDEVHEEPQNDFVTVLVPEFVTAHWWEAFLHNQTATLLRSFLAFRKNVVVVTVRHHLSE